MRRTTDISVTPSVLVDDRPIRKPEETNERTAIAPSVTIGQWASSII